MALWSHDRRVGAADPRHGLEGVADDPRRRGTGPRLDEGWVTRQWSEGGGSQFQQARKKVVRCEPPSRILKVSASDPRGTCRSVRETLEGPRGRCEKPSRVVEVSARDPRGRLTRCAKPSRVVEVSAREPRATSETLQKTLEALRGQCERPSRLVEVKRETLEVVEGFASRPRGPLRVLEGVEELKVPRGAYTDVVPGGN